MHVCFYDPAKVIEYYKFTKFFFKIVTKNISVTKKYQTKHLLYLHLGYLKKINFFRDNGLFL